VARVAYSAQALQDAAPDFAETTLLQIQSAVEILSAHPRIGRRVHGPRRELVISVGASGYLALYRFDPALDIVRILRLRHQREAGYRE